MSVKLSNEKRSGSTGSDVRFGASGQSLSFASSALMTVEIQLASPLDTKWQRNGCDQEAWPLGQRGVDKERRAGSYSDSDPEWLKCILYNIPLDELPSSPDI